ncbi:MAG: hypothetical protein M3O82_03455 [Verrucomicrobiota bacterium]|nr:hypothetical protein [Verrucomicrobiota bacterium]
MSRKPIFISATGLFLALTIHAQAQLKVDLKISRRLFLAYEPVVATVSVTNLSGREITLQDAGADKWFGFQITSGEDRPVPPRDANYALDPLTIKAGETLKRSVNLTSLYPITDFGLYRVRASIFFADLQRYFSSPASNIEITEGKVIWQQTVGVPEGQPGAGSYRTISLLTHRLPKDNMLYVRVEDRDGDTIYATGQIGRILFSVTPDVQLDAANQLYILQLVGQRTYLLTRIGINGEWLGQITYNAVGTRPSLRRMADGHVEVVGGQVDVRVAQPANGPVAAKLSDRPPGLPKRR